MQQIQMFRLNCKRKRGFTLLEILVVITLIILIAGIAIPRFAGVTDEGRRAKSAAEQRTIQTALESYLLNVTATLPAATNGNVGDLETVLEGAAPRLVGEMDDFVDPFGATATTQYLYKIDTNSRYYVIHSLGPDRTADITGIQTDGDITPANPDDDVFVTNGQLQA
jgi:prepilin-type N-terminal cleavage/methylation domain-containing protein